MTAISVGVIIVCWVLFGFGLSGVDIVIFSTPLWIIMGCLGTWVVAIIASVILSSRVIEDCPLDEDDFGRKYQMEDPTPVEVSPMMIDPDIMRKIERKNTRHVHPRKPVSNTQRHAGPSRTSTDASETERDPKASR